MTATLRPMTDRDLPAVVALSLRAWAPVFDSMREALGEELFGRLHPEGIAGQAGAVRATCTSERMHVVVADVDGIPVGFVAYAADGDTRVGEVDMLAVDPAHQGRGLGTLLTTHAVEALRSSGMAVAMIETGGDPGHAPARRTYEKSGATLLPIARYFTAL